MNGQQKSHFKGPIKGGGKGNEDELWVEACPHLHIIIINTMGAECAGCHSHSNRRAKQGMDIETYPDDIVDYSPNSRPNLPALKFDAMLSNIKVVNSPKVYFLVNEVFVIPEVLH